MSVVTNSASEVQPVSEVVSPPVNDSAPVQEPAGDEPSPKKAKVEEPTATPPAKPGRKSRGSSGMSVAERTRLEAEAIIKDLKDTPDGGRRTRSATRGTPAPSVVQAVVSPRAGRKPRVSTPAVKSTAATAEKKPAARGRGRPPRKSVNATPEKTDEVDQSNNGTETTSSDAPSATNAAESSEPVPEENGIEGESHDDVVPEPVPVVAPVVVEVKKVEPVQEKESVPSPTDPWAAEAAKASESSKPSVTEEKPKQPEVVTPEVTTIE